MLLAGMALKRKGLRKEMEMSGKMRRR